MGIVDAASDEEAVVPLHVVKAWHLAALFGDDELLLDGNAEGRVMSPAGLVEVVEDDFAKGALFGLGVGVGLVRLQDDEPDELGFVVGSVRESHCDGEVLCQVGCVGSVGR